MRNHWTVERNHLVVWEVSLPRDRPDDLRAWQRSALRRGEELGVYRIDEVPDIGYRRRDHGPLEAFLDARPALDDGIALLGHDSTTSSRLAYVDADGTLVERDVSDLGDALAETPTGATVLHRPPLEVWAGSVPPDESTFAVRISTNSDIWLPWSSARFEPEHEPEDFADNRVLAERHTPRLNAFLDALRSGALGIGGSWVLDAASSDRDILFEVDEFGVRLDAPQPLDRIFSCYPDGTRRDGVLAAIRDVVPSVDEFPPPPPYQPLVRVGIRRLNHELIMADADAILDALRHPDDPANRLTPEAVRGVRNVQIDNDAGRYTFPIDALLAP